MSSVEEETPDLDYGVALGACMGVVAYSNLDSYYFSGEKHFCQGVFTGYKYQCVEYARRHMLLSTGYIFGQCGPAAHLFDHTEVTSVVTKEKRPWVGCPNGSTATKPKPGMTIIYPIDKKMPVGHVAVIAEVGEDWVGIAEENEGSKPWNGLSYGRKLPLKHDVEKDTWTIVETDPGFVPSRGWLYIDGGDDCQAPLPGVTEADMTTVNATTVDEKVYPKYQVHQDLIEENNGPKRMAKFETPNMSPTAGQEGEKTARGGLLEEYLKVLAAGGAQLKPGQYDDTATGSYQKFGLSGVKRRTEISSVISPNQELGVASIGMVMRSFRLVETFLAHLLVASGVSKEELAARYQMPVEMIAIAKAAFTADNSKSSAGLSSVDFALGTMGLAYDPVGDAYRLLHTEFDTLPYLMDLNAFQEPYVYGKAGITKCWIMTSYGYDFHRSVRNFQKFKLHNAKADEVMYAIDFGSVAELAAQGVVLAEDEAYAYTVERLNQLYTIEYMKEVLIEKKKDFDEGNISDEDLPKWTIQSVNFFEQQQEGGNPCVEFQKGSSKVTVAGQEAKLMWKCTSWKFLFQFAQGSERVKEFVTEVAANNIGIFQPAWTHIAAQPRFQYDLAVWAEQQDVDLVLPEIGKPVDFVIPSKHWTEGPTGPCTAVFSPTTTKVNPTLDGEAYKVPETTSESSAEDSKDKGSKRAAYSYASMHCLVAGGKRSAGLWLESKSSEKDAGGVTVGGGVHPAPSAFIMGEIGW